MRAKELKRKYPNFWKAVESGVLEDLKLCMPGYMVELSKKNSDDILHRVAHNAAFTATFEHYKKIKLMQL